MNRVADVIRDDIKVMTAYQVADLPEGFIKLDAMECPIILSPGMNLYYRNGRIWQSRRRFICIPILPRAAFYEELRKVFGIPDKAEIALGNGSRRAYPVFDYAGCQTKCAYIGC